MSSLEKFSVFMFQFPSFSSSVFGCSPVNSHTHHDMLGIVQEMPLGRTFLSGITFRFELFILTHLRSALTWNPVDQPVNLLLICCNSSKIWLNCFLPVSFFLRECAAYPIYLCRNKPLLGNEGKHHHHSGEESQWRSSQKCPSNQKTEKRTLRQIPQ